MERAYIFSYLRSNRFPAIIRVNAASEHSATCSYFAATFQLFSSYFAATLQLLCSYFAATLQALCSIEKKGEKICIDRVLLPSNT
jgi:hypothetical protein